MVAGNLVIYVVGAPVLAVVAGMSLPDAISRGALVFVPWDLLKVLVAAIVLPRLWALARD